MTYILLNKKRECGAATLIITVLLLVMSTLIIIFAANFGTMRDKVTGNLYNDLQAFNAADAGLEYGINYLVVNSATILANPVGGYINYTTGAITNVSLANNSTYSITYTNPTASNYNTIRISSTGTSADGTATRTVKQDVAKSSLLSSPPTVPLLTQGAVSMGSGNSNASVVVTNTSNNNTIHAGSGVTMYFTQTAAKTVIGSGVSSYNGHIQSDINQSDSTLHNLTQASFFSTYVGASSSTLQSAATHTYTNSVNTDYSATIGGMTNAIIWINQTGGTTGSFTNDNSWLGSSASPVLLIVNGNFTYAAGFYGLMVVLGTLTITNLGGTGINGAVAATGLVTMSASAAAVTYSPSVLTALAGESALALNWAKVPSSWRDF